MEDDASDAAASAPAAMTDGSPPPTVEPGSRQQQDQQPIVVLDDDDGTTRATPAARTVKKRKSVEIPEEIADEAGLRRFVDYSCKLGKSNASFRCPQCTHDGLTATGFKWNGFKDSYLWPHAKDFTAWRELAARVYPVEAVGKFGGGVADARATTPQVKRITQDPSQALLTAYFAPAMEAQTKVRAAVAQMLIGCMLPISIVEHPDFRLAVARIVEVVKAHPNRPIEELLCGRTAMTTTVDSVAKTITTTAVDEKKLYIAAVGSTLTMDGRTNINGTPVIAMILEGSFGMCPLGAVSTTSAAKDARYIADLVKSKILSGEELTSSVIAVCMDGARANINAMAILEKELHLLTIRCQTHLFSLLIKDIFKLDGIAIVTKGVETAYSWVRHHQRVFTRFMELSNKRPLIRPVAVRFAIFPVAVQRMLALRGILNEMLGDGVYKEYVENLPKKAKVQAKEFKELICNASFWDTAEFVKKVTEPMVRALRIMDQRYITPNAAAALWDSLGPRVLSVVKTDEFSSVPRETKAGVIKAYLARSDEASCELLDAAWVLDPANWCEVIRLKASCDSADETTWGALAASARTVLCRLVDRLKLSESAAAREDAKVRVVHEFTQYACHSGVFSDVATPKTGVEVDVQAWWGLHEGVLLAKYARRVLNVCVTISNDERIHKLYSLVQPPERTRLAPERTDALVKAAHWLQASRIEGRQVNRHVRDFVDLPGLTSSEYDDYLAMLTTPAAEAMSAPKRKASGDADSDADEVDDDGGDAEGGAASSSVGAVGDDEGAAESDSDAAGGDAAAGDAGGDGTADNYGTHPTFENGELVRRSRRAARRTVNLTEAMEALQRDEDP